MQYPEEKLL